jgi:glycosyltransferase involved in cell wall biosynthesis
MSSSRLTIGIDYRPALSRATGVGRYFEGLLSGLTRVDRENLYLLFTSSFKERPRPASRPGNFRLVDRRLPVRLLNWLWHRLEIPPLDSLTGESLDVVHSPTPLLVPARRARAIVTVCDLFFLDHPETTRAEIRRDYAALVRGHARRAEAVLAISETTARDVAEKLAVPEDRIVVIHAGVDERFLANGAPPGESSGSNGGSGGGSGGERPYLLAVATEEPRKNLPRLLEAVALLGARGWDGRLVLAGGPGLDTPNLHEAIGRLGLGTRVTRLGYVGPEALPSLYRRARALVLPSLWEGFGLPLLEAMASGIPIVASDIPVHREVAAEAAVFAPAEDAGGLAEAIEDVWFDDSLRSRLVGCGRERVAAFSWEASAKKALALYQRVGRARN